jgi:hypothetical protein
MPNVEFLSATQPFCVWAQASRNFAIQIPPEVIGSLGTESLVALKRIPGRGLETGGILLGRTELRDDTTTFWIEGFAPIESEHRFGPSYLLSESDLAHFQRELTRNGTSSLGIYRSQTRSEKLAIQDADAGLFEKCFEISDNLFLMVAPLSRLGAFYFPEDGKLKCVHQFTLVSSLSSGATQGRTSSPQVNLQPPPSAETHIAHANIARPSADQADALIVASQSSDLTKPPAVVSTINGDAGNMLSHEAIEGRSPVIKLWRDCSGRGSGIKLMSLVMAAVTLAVLTAYLLSYSVRHSAVPDHRALNYLYLTVERAGPALRLLWDGHSSAMRGATRAVLHVQDGDQQTDRELAPSEFLAGQFTYQPQHSAVTFRLNVYAAEPDSIGLVQVMSPQSPMPATHSIEPIPQTPQNRRPSAQSQVKPIARPKAPPAASAPTVQSDNDKDQNIAAQLPLVRRSDVSEIRPFAAISALKLPEPFRPTDVKPSRQHSPVADTNDGSTSGRKLSVQVSTTPVLSSRFGRLFGKIPFVGHSRKHANAVGAVPVYQEQPTIRMPNDRQLIRPVAVGVKVYVSESGSVNDAEVVEYGDPLNLTLANAALAASRNWTFAPSRIDDIPVASQVIIRFYFSP